MLVRVVVRWDASASAAVRCAGKEDKFFRTLTRITTIYRRRKNIYVQIDY